MTTEQVRDVGANPGSLYSDRLTNRVRRCTPKAILSTVLEDQGDCFGETFARFGFGFALTVRSGNFETVRDIP